MYGACISMPNVAYMLDRPLSFSGTEEKSDRVPTLRNRGTVASYFFLSIFVGIPMSNNCLLTQCTQENALHMHNLI